MKSPSSHSKYYYTPGLRTLPAWPPSEVVEDGWLTGAAINNVFTRAMEACASHGRIGQSIEMCRWIDWPIGFPVEIIWINWKHGREEEGRWGGVLIYRPHSEEEKMATSLLETWWGGFRLDANQTYIWLVWMLNPSIDMRYPQICQPIKICCEVKRLKERIH